MSPSGATPRVQIHQRDGKPHPERFELLQTLLEKGYAVSLSGNRAEDGTDAGEALVLDRWSPEEESDAPEGAVVDRSAPLPDLEGLTAAQVLDLVEEARRQLDLPARKAWKPWFPVIDYSRCTNCMQCLSFCLFGVYGVSPEGKIQVKNQDSCKTDCPACSRVCPEVAILFPKYRQGPINGDEIDPEDLRREAMKVDISALLGGDIYAALRDRSARAKSRFSKERDEERALKERERCLDKLREKLEIPAEVLASLPSPDEIRARAEAARARAQADSAGERTGA